MSNEYTQYTPSEIGLAIQNMFSLSQIVNSQLSSMDDEMVLAYYNLICSIKLGIESENPIVLLKPEMLLDAEARESK